LRHALERTDDGGSALRAGGTASAVSLDHCSRLQEDQRQCSPRSLDILRHPRPASWWQLSKDLFQFFLQSRHVLPKTAIGTLGFIAAFEDSENNRIGLRSWR
jgi:hypothetical protein